MYRVGSPTWDQTTGTLVVRLDETVTHRRLPTYLASDNARTVTVEHVARIAVRHPMVAALPAALWVHGGLV
jgi:hypothetical protein